MPAGLRVSELVVGEETMVVFSFPLAQVDEAALTASEREVATLVLAGLTNAQIAARRQTTVATVAKQLESIYRKLSVRGRRELAALAAKGGLATR